MTNTYRPIALNEQQQIKTHVTRISTNEVTYVSTSSPIEKKMKQYWNISKQWRQPAILRRADWWDKDFREGYMEGAVEQTIAWQIRANREARNMSQRDLAVLIGTKQSAISRLEDPSNGQLSVKTLQKVANAFQCALSVKLVSYAQLAEESRDLRPAALTVRSFEQDIHFYSSLKNDDTNITGTTAIAGNIA